MKKKKSFIAVSSMLSVMMLLSSNTLAKAPEQQYSQQNSGQIEANGYEKVSGINPSIMSESIKYELENGMTKPIYSTDDAIKEDLFVETTVDSDRDGKFDRISIKVMRPNTDPGIKVPVIYEISPYN